jgi:hypothetical protein
MTSCRQAFWAMKMLHAVLLYWELKGENDHAEIAFLVCPKRAFGCECGCEGLSAAGSAAGGV